MLRRARYLKLSLSKRFPMICTNRSSVFLMHSFLPFGSRQKMLAIFCKRNFYLFWSTQLDYCCIVRSFKINSQNLLRYHLVLIQISCKYHMSINEEIDGYFSKMIKTKLIRRQASQKRHFFFVLWIFSIIRTMKQLFFFRQMIRDSIATKNTSFGYGMQML